MTNEERDKIILENLDIVQKNVSRTIKRVSLNIDAEELTNHLYLSLVVSAAKFDETRGVPVRRFLDSRLKSSCTDYLRITDHMSIFMRSKLKRLEKSNSNLAHTLLREPTHAELADSLELTEDGLRKYMLSVQDVRVASLNPDGSCSVVDDNSDEKLATHRFQELRNNVTPEDTSMANEILDKVISVFSKYPKRSQLLYILYFLYNLKLKDLSDIFGLHVAHISEITCNINNNIRQHTKRFSKED